MIYNIPIIKKQKYLEQISTDQQK